MEIIETKYCKMFNDNFQNLSFIVILLPPIPSQAVILLDTILCVISNIWLVAGMSKHFLFILYFNHEIII